MGQPESAMPAPSPAPANTAPADRQHTAPGLADLGRCFGQIGLVSFGGPAAQIALLHRAVVEERRWLSEAEYLRALSFCMLLPGPEAMQLATWIGWRLGGMRGGLIAGGLFLAPGALAVLALSMLYAGFGAVPLVAALFTGLQAAVIVLVAQALIRLARRALRGTLPRLIAIAAFLGLFLFNLPFPVILLAAGAFGLFALRGPAGTSTSAPFPAPPWRDSMRNATIWAGLWLGPLALLQAFAPTRLAELALFLSKLAALSFGGAYALLAWMTQEAVNRHGWLSLSQMIDGLALAETTPGPLILVTEFLGYMAGYGAGGMALGLAGAAVALWMTFVPSFLFVFAGAPFVARLGQMPRLAGALAGISAAVVGTIAHLSLWFALHVLFGRITAIEAGPLQLIWPDLTSLRPVPLFLAGLAAFTLLWLRWRLSLVLMLCATSAAIISTFATVS